MLMADHKLTIAAAARTPLYLPLYVVALNYFLPSHRRYSISIIEPQDKTVNGDHWAAARVADREADFAVCDPLAACEMGGVCVVASVVNRAAFWFVSRGTEVHQLGQLASVNEIYTYPEHMTGYHVAHFISQAAGGATSVKGVSVDSELDPVVAPPQGSKVIALTPNLISAYRYRARYPEASLRISPVWDLHSNLWTLMLTALLTRKETVTQDNQVVTDLVSGFSKASAMISFDREFAAEILVNAYRKVDSEKSEDPSDERHSEMTSEEARQVIEKLHATRIHPVTPYPDITSWHNARLIRPGSANPAADTTYNQYVRAESAGAVENRYLETLVRYSEGELYNDIINRLLPLKELRLSELSVIGSYYRYDEQPRRILRDVVDRIRRAVRSKPGDFRENFILWGESSAGKSYLIEQLAEVDKAGLTFVQVNLGKHKRDYVEAELQKLASASGPRLCLIDEIDAKASAGWSYDLVFSYLDLRIDGAEIVFVLTGSTMGSASELTKHIAKEYKQRKGADLETRIPIHGGVDIPNSILEDRITIAAGQLFQKARTVNKPVAYVEKSALYYMLVKEGLGAPRHLSDLAGSTAARLSARSDHSVRYEDLFDEGDRDREKDFNRRHISAFEVLENSYLTIGE
jgi:hypothetical protein